MALAKGRFFPSQNSVINICILSEIADFFSISALFC
nr:MAG TPA: hypothetical protein [Caudoviricetes sp.]